MIPEPGDIVRISSGLFEKLEGDGDGSWAEFKGHDLKVTHVTSVTSNILRIRWKRVDGVVTPSTPFMTVDRDGNKMGCQAFVEGGTVYEPNKDDRLCMCKQPKLVTTGIGSLSFKVCRKCGYERR